MPDVSISKLEVENVRCFGKKQVLNIHPVTMLVGENSTGKTTLLACLDTLVRYFSSKALDFNFPPYDMGGFQDIVRAGCGGFRLTMTVCFARDEVDWSFEFGQLPEKPTPTIKSLELRFNDGKVTMQANHNRQDNRYLVSKYKNNTYTIEFSRKALDTIDLTILREPSVHTMAGDDFAARESLVSYLQEKIKNHGAWWLIDDTIRSWGCAPVRTKPRRTYHTADFGQLSEGGGVLWHAAQVNSEDKQAWDALQKNLRYFGHASGLFDDIIIRKVDTGSSFEVLVNIRGHQANIANVGYGLSQILPTLLERHFKPMYHANTRELPRKIYVQLQQPEVHLHPKAQAELCSLLASLSRREDTVKQSFLIETHGDQLINRLRIEIRLKNIGPDNASLAYLEATGNAVRIHNISFDELANMKGVPEGYRDFFLEESDRLHGF